MVVIKHKCIGFGQQHATDTVWAEHFAIVSMLEVVES